MNDADLTYLFGLKPEAAIAYLRAKGYEISWDWTDVWQESQARAFTVAKAMRLDILQDIRDEITAALDNGTTFAEFKKTLTPKLKSKGWWGEVVNEQTGEIAVVGPHRLRTIFDTNIQTAYSAGHYRSQIQNVADRPWWIYSAVNDSRTRPAHAALNGLAFRHDDPFWQSHYPPNGFRCRCSVRAVGDGQLEELTAQGRAGQRSTADGSATLETVQLPAGRSKGMVDSTTVVTTGLDGRRLAVAPDAGWSYNPGAVDWQPDLDKYSPEIRKLW